jgi:hypothetical protein
MQKKLLFSFFVVVVKTAKMVITIREWEKTFLFYLKKKNCDLTFESRRWSGLCVLSCIATCDFSFAFFKRFAICYFLRLCVFRISKDFYVFFVNKISFFLQIGNTLEWLVNMDLLQFFIFLNVSIFITFLYQKVSLNTKYNFITHLFRYIFSLLSDKSVLLF